ncbi:MAG: (Fe-S)-binding protein [Halobacteriota archaeon]
MMRVPAGKNCGACGAATCEQFVVHLEKGEKSQSDCPYYESQKNRQHLASVHSGTDVLGNTYDFVLRPFPSEPSARKFIVPFRADLVERWNISPGELVIGRPAGPGCPLYHALRVLSANPVTGVLECHTLGPLAAREEETHDVQAYHVHAFEGLAEVVHNEPVLGKRQRFLPGYCMLNLSHTAVVNTVLKKREGVHVRLEDIRIM